MQRRRKSPEKKIKKMKPRTKFQEAWPFRAGTIRGLKKVDSFDRPV